MLCNLLREMTSEDFDEIESLFKEIFEFKVSEGLEKKINSEMSAFKEHLPKASKNKLDSIARPLENTAYYIDVVDSTQRRIAHDIVKKFNWLNQVWFHYWNELSISNLVYQSFIEKVDRSIVRINLGKWGFHATSILH